MSSPRAWILCLAAVTFLAGGAAGLILGRDLWPPPPEGGPFADYHQLLVERFELSPERARGLRAILDRYHQDVEAVKASRMSAMEPELVKLGRDYRRLIRDKVLPAGKREEFDRLAAGAATP